MPNVYEQTNQILQKLTNLTQSPKQQPPYKETAQAMLHPNTVETTPCEVLFTDTLPTPADDLSPTSTVSPIGFELWEALAYDLALDHTSREQIAEAYSLTLEQLDHLQSNDYFYKMLKAKQEEVKQLGSDAAFTVKMRIVANRATPQFMQRLLNPAASNKEFQAFFRQAVELAQLVPKPQSDDTPTPVAIGAAVTFNIQGVPGLEHLSTTSSTSAEPDTDIIDATFTELTEQIAADLDTDEPTLQEL